MITIQNTGGTLTKTSKGLVYGDKPSNVNNVYKMDGVLKVVISGATENAYFMIDNPNSFSLTVSYAGKTVEVTPGLLEAMALSSNSITITGPEAFDINIFDVKDITTYDVLSSLGARVSEMTLVQHNNTIFPNSASIMDNIDGFIGNFGSRVVNLEIFDEDINLFNKDLPFEVYHEFMIKTKSDFFDLKPTSNRVKLGTFKYDKEDSKYDDSTKKHTIVGYEDIGAYGEARKINLQQGETGAQIMLRITNLAGKPAPVYLCDMPMNDYVFNKINYNPEELTKLSYWIRMYAELNLCNAYIINDRLTFISMIDSEPEYTLRQVDYADTFDMGDVEIINTITFEAEEAVEDPINVGDHDSIQIHGIKDFRMVGNQFINLLGRGEVTGILHTLLPKFFLLNPEGYFYRPFETNNIYINPRMGFMNSIHMEDRDFNIWRSHITQFEWTYTPGVSGKVAGVKGPDSETVTDMSREAIKQVNMGIKVDRINQSITSLVEEINGMDGGGGGIIDNLDMTKGDYTGWTFTDLNEVPVVEPIFDIVNPPGSRSGVGQRFTQVGVAISPKGYVSPEEKYSMSVTHDSEVASVLSFTLLEYNAAGTLINSEPLALSGLGEVNTSFYTQAETSSLSIAIRYGNVNGNEATRTVRDMIVNKGEPRSWGSTPKDLELWTRTQITQLRDSITSTAENLLIVDGVTQSNKSEVLQMADSVSTTLDLVTTLNGEVVTLSSSVTQSADAIHSLVTETQNLDGRLVVSESAISQSADAIHSLVTETQNLDGRLVVSESAISQFADEISLKVSKDDLIAEINLQPGLVLIDADKINLSGYTTFTEAGTMIEDATMDNPTFDNLKDGVTIINGGNILTGRVGAAYIDFDTATGVDVDLSGKITAIEGKIGAYDITEGALVGNNITLGYSYINIGGTILTGEISQSTGEPFMLIEGFTTFRDYVYMEDSLTVNDIYASELNVTDSNIAGNQIVSGDQWVLNKLEVGNPNRINMGGGDIDLYGELKVIGFTGNTHFSIVRSPQADGLGIVASSDTIVSLNGRVYLSGDRVEIGPDTDFYAGNRVFMNTWDETSQGGPRLFAFNELRTIPEYPGYRNIVVLQAEKMRPITSSSGDDIGMATHRYEGIFLRNQPNVESDIRVKSVIEDIPESLVNRLMNIKAKKYTQRGKVHFGYIAQDVEREIYKYCVDQYGYENANVAMENYAVLYKSESKLSLLYGEISVLKDAYYMNKFSELEERLKNLEN